MKKLLLTLVTTWSLHAYSQSADSGNSNDIEQRIKTASINAINNGPGHLTKIADSLEALSNNSVPTHKYWHAYTLYKLAQYYISKDRNASEKQTTKAIEVLEAIPNKSSDENVLFGLLTSLSINFFPGKAATLSPKAKECFVKAIELDKSNPRAYYGLARSDFYKPKQYGGGLVVEENLLKALSISNGNTSNSLAPTWGREESYSLLLSYYLREERKQDAVLFYKKAIKEFPDSKDLQQFQPKLPL